ncbi:hypothetical protein ES705_00012 [subsurface metagenome]|nr:amidohydrolase family protein [Clostridia bacterium]
MIIDMHAHVGPAIKDERLRTIADGHPQNNVEEYLKAMDKAGVDMAVTFGFLDIDIEYQAKIQKKYPDRIISFAWVNPRHPDAVNLFKHGVEDLELKGLKLHGFWHQTPYSSHVMLDPLIEICDKYNLPVILHTEGGNAFTTPLHAEELAKRWPKVNFVMSHGGMWWSAREALLVAKRTANLYFDNAASETVMVSIWVEEIGANRVVMGSDWPWNYLDGVVKTTEISVPNPEDRKWVMGKTAAKLLGLRIKE